MLTPSFSALVFLLIYFSCISSFMKCNSYSLMFFHFLFLVVIKFCFLFKILYSTVTGRMKYMIKMRNYLFSITWLCLESFAKPGLRQRLKSLNCISDLLLPLCLETGRGRTWVKLFTYVVPFILNKTFFARKQETILYYFKTCFRTS